MKNQNRVVWTKGMFLNPQHFQTQDQYFEDALQFRFGASSYANWGVVTLEIDAEAVSTGRFRLIEAAGLLPDGLAFRMPEADPLPPGREFAEFLKPPQKELDVYLAIPEHRVDTANVTMAGKAVESADTRYIAETRMVADFNSGEDPKAVQIARKNFRIMFGPEYRDGFTGLRVAQITLNAAGAFVLKPTHIAPCLDIAHNKYLLGLVQTLVGILSNKSESLSLSGRDRGKSLTDLPSTDMAKFWLLHTVNTSLPEFRHIWKVRHGHPEHVYLAMARLAGALASFFFDFSLEDLPDYDHRDLGRCFAQLDSQIRRLIDIVIVEPYTSIPLVLGEGGVWTAAISDDHWFEDSQIYLGVSANLSSSEIIQKVPMRVRLAAVDEINRLIHRALGGIELTYTAVPPAIRMKLGSHYFQLGQSGEHWQKVQKSRSIAVFAPSDLESAKLELIVVKNKRA